MREKKFKGFDDIHCPAKWKEETMKHLEKTPTTRPSYAWKLVAVFLFLLLSFGTAYAYSDAIQAWLSSLFSTEKQPVEVKPDPVTIKELKDVTFLDSENRYYVKMSNEEVQQAHTLTIYEKGTIVGKDLPHKSTVLNLVTDINPVEVVLHYVQLHDRILPLYLDEEKELPSSSVMTLPDGSVVIQYMIGNYLNAYLLDQNLSTITSIGDLSYTSETNGMRIYAYQVLPSSSARYVLYRTYAGEQGWAQDKMDAQWVLYDRKNQTRRYMDQDKLPGYLIGNELRMAKDHKIITTQTYKVDETTEAYYPVVYDYTEDTWTAYKDYECNVPFTSDYVYRIQDASIEVLDVTTGEKQKLSLPEHYAQYGTFQLYDGFYIYEDGSAFDVYVVSQKRWVHLEDTPFDELITLYPLDNHTLSINQQYLVEFQEDKQNQ